MLLIDDNVFILLFNSVSVDEFKKLLGKNEEKEFKRSSNSRSRTTTEEEQDVINSNRRVVYARKIIQKFMSKDSFFDIASENLLILNKSVWSFGTFLRNDLMMCSSLSSHSDLFADAEIAVKKALQPSFTNFTETTQYHELLQYVQINEDLSTALSLPSPPPASNSLSGNTSPLAPPISPSPRTYLTLSRVLGNRRLCSVFWVFLFKERTHQMLSLWMDFRYRLVPLLNHFITLTEDEILEENEVNPHDISNQILNISEKINVKYLIPKASTEVYFVGASEQELVSHFKAEVELLARRSAYSNDDADNMLKTVRKIMASVEYFLKVNHFVRFMGSESFKSLVASYQSRLLGSSGVFDASTPAPVAKGTTGTMSDDYPEDTISNVSDSTDCSMTTLQELFQCLNVASHRPQRIRSKTFLFKDLYAQQQEAAVAHAADIISSPSGITPISCVLRFQVDASGRSQGKDPEIIKKVLFSVAKDSDLRHHHSIPDHVEAFFCPGGAELIRATSAPEPKLFHMTIGNAEKSFYAACLTRYVVENDASQLNPLEEILRDEEGLEVYVPVGFCVISRYPILNTLKRRLERLHLEMEQDEAYNTDMDWEPSADQMDQILLCPYEFPSTILASSNPLPLVQQHNDFSMEELFNCLSIDNIISLVSCMLLERQVVLTSSRYSVLTCAGETLKSLISPLVWSHVFAPILPKSMLECLQCPTPYLFGVHASYRTEVMEMLGRDGSDNDILLVDFDINTLSAPVTPQIPDHIRLPLVSELERLLIPRIYYSDVVPMSVPSPTNRRGIGGFPLAGVRQAFATAIRNLMDHMEEYRFVLSDDFDYVVVFDNDGYLEKLSSEDKPFYSSFLETQVFSHDIASVN
jgi:hypothetical protein